MRPYTKGFILLFTLLFPILIYLFLRFFGNNKYELPLIDVNKNIKPNEKPVGGFKFG